MTGAEEFRETNVSEELGSSNGVGSLTSRLITSGTDFLTGRKLSGSDSLPGRMFSGPGFLTGRMFSGPGFLTGSKTSRGNFAFSFETLRFLVGGARAT